MPNIKPKDVIAVYVILILAILMIAKVQGDFTAFLGLIVGYYFGHRTSGVDEGV